MTETEFEYINTPDPVVQFVGGSYPRITYTVDWDLREHPSPKDFRKVSDAEISLLVMATDQPEHIDEKIGEIHDHIVELRSMMMDQRGIGDQEDRADLAMGHLEKLPEVVKRESEQIREGSA